MKNTLNVMKNWAQNSTAVRRPETCNFLVFLSHLFIPSMLLFLKGKLKFAINAELPAL
jgi:hypothetical protein